MKKSVVVALVATLVSANLYADSWLQGSVVEVKDAQKTVVIDTIHSGYIEVKILPSTKIELDDCGWFGLADSWIGSDYGNFWDLKEGRYLEVDAYYPNYQAPAGVVAGAQAPQGVATATKVEVKCRPKAY